MWAISILANIHFIHQLQLSRIPRQELKRQLQTPFQCVQLVNVAAHALISIVVSWAEFLQKKYKNKEKKQLGIILTLECFYSWKIKESVPLEGHDPQRAVEQERQCSCSCISFQALLRSPHILHTKHNAGPQPVRETKYIQFIQKKNKTIKWPFNLDTFWSSKKAHGRYMLPQQQMNI